MLERVQRAPPDAPHCTTPVESCLAGVTPPPLNFLPVRRYRAYLSGLPRDSDAVKQRMHPLVKYLKLVSGLTLRLGNEIGGTSHGAVASPPYP